jgi:carbamoyl-phosphate synthase small subunit
MVCRAVNPPSSWRAEESLADALAREGVPAICGIDTRALTLRLRSGGTLKGRICCSGKSTPEEAVAAARAWGGLDGQDYAAAVSCTAPYDWPTAEEMRIAEGVPAALPDGFGNDAGAARPLVAVLDFGIKFNTLRALTALGARVRVFPAKTTAETLLAAKPDGVLLSNGPADPAALPYAVETIRGLLGRVPLMGICLGHQLLALSLGARTARLPFGHHGCNHPVQRLADGAVEITSQNHNFVVVEDTLPKDTVRVTHRSLNDGSVEGLEAPGLRAFSLQYHPEAAPGPHDAAGAFGRFLAGLRG